MNIFEPHVKNNELHVDEFSWNVIKLNYDQKTIIQYISDAIVEFNIKLPYKEISLAEAIEDFEKLKEFDSQSLICDGEWGTKFDYKYNFLDKYIGMSNVGLDASNYFHQKERWKCDATGYPSPQKTWETERFRLTLFKALFSLNVKEINPQVLRNIISLRKYIAAQFRPSAAKAIYEYFGAEKVLDFSSGWGDRFAGAYASDTVKTYLGFDPNHHLQMGYYQQHQIYGTMAKLTNRILPVEAEDKNVHVATEVDLVFTSPPYFDKEKYSNDKRQSFIKHKGFDNWMENFLFKAIELRTEKLKVGGHLVINISDIYTRKKLYKICDGMNDFIASMKNFEYIGAMGLRMPKRPMSKSSKNAGIYGEPIWIWKKIK